jgi:hypothetical protein
MVEVDVRILKADRVTLPDVTACVGPINNALHRKVSKSTLFKMFKMLRKT